MSSIFDDTMSTAKNVVGSARENAENAMGAAKAGAEQAAAKSRSVFLDRVRTVTHLIAVARSLGGDDLLGWIGLARRRSPLGTVAAFGAGMAIGAGAALILAPTSGQALRAKILDHLRMVNGEAVEPMAQATTTAPGPGRNGDARVANRNGDVAVGTGHRGFGWL